MVAERAKNVINSHYISPVFRTFPSRETHSPRREERSAPHLPGRTSLSFVPQMLWTDSPSQSYDAYAGASSSRVSDWSTRISTGIHRRACSRFARPKDPGITAPRKSFQVLAHPRALELSGSGRGFSDRDSSRSATDHLVTRWCVASKPANDRVFCPSHLNLVRTTWRHRSR